MRALILFAGLAAAASFAVLMWFHATALLPAAGGLRPFDMRVTGYTVAEAGAYLAVLTDAGRAAIRGPVALWDTVFPVALGLFLALLCLAQRGRVGWLGALVAVLYSGVDLAENAAIRRLVDGPVDPDPLIVSGASTLTMAKYALLLLACLLFFVARLRR